MEAAAVKARSDLNTNGATESFDSKENCEEQGKKKISMSEGLDQKKELTKASIILIGFVPSSIMAILALLAYITTSSMGYQHDKDQLILINYKLDQQASDREKDALARKDRDDSLDKKLEKIATDSKEFQDFKTRVEVANKLLHQGGNPDGQ